MNYFQIVHIIAVNNINKNIGILMTGNASGYSEVMEDGAVTSDVHGAARPFPEDQSDFVNNGISVFTREDRSDPTAPEFHHTYSKLEFVLNQNLFFDKSIYSDNSWNQRSVTYQALYLTSPLWGFCPAPIANYANPPAGQFTISRPDRVMKSEVWVMGVILGEESEYPDYVPRQSPWFKLSETYLYRK